MFIVLNMLYKQYLYPLYKQWLYSSPGKSIKQPLKYFLAKIFSTFWPMFEKTSKFKKSMNIYTKILKQNVKDKNDCQFQ